MAGFLIAGLGNPGEEYRMTRHNAGFMVLDRWAEKEGLKFETGRLAEICRLRHKGKSFVLIKPSTFMNRSGRAVNYWMQEEKIHTGSLLVIADDIAFPFGTLRLKGKGSDGGHNGLKDIAETLNTTEYARLRFGIGDSFPKGGQSDYVLTPFSAEERIVLPEKLDTAIEIVKSFALAGLQRTMTAFNKKD